MDQRVAEGISSGLCVKTSRKLKVSGQVHHELWTLYIAPHCLQGLYHYVSKIVRPVKGPAWYQNWASKISKFKQQPQVAERFLVSKWLNFKESRSHKSKRLKSPCN